MITVKEQNLIDCNVIAHYSPTKTLRSPAPTAKAIALVALEVAIALAAQHAPCDR
jgi:hypothetical protein